MDWTQDGASKPFWPRSLLRKSFLSLKGKLLSQLSLFLAQCEQGGLSCPGSHLVTVREKLPVARTTQALYQTCPEAARVSAVPAGTAEMPAPQGASTCQSRSASSEGHSVWVSGFMAVSPGTRRGPHTAGA